MTNNLFNFNTTSTPFSTGTTPSSNPSSTQPTNLFGNKPQPGNSIFDPKGSTSTSTTPQPNIFNQPNTTATPSFGSNPTSTTSNLFPSATTPALGSTLITGTGSNLLSNLNQPKPPTNPTPSTQPQPTTNIFNQPSTPSLFNPPSTSTTPANPTQPQPTSFLNTEKPKTDPQKNPFGLTSDTNKSSTQPLSTNPQTAEQPKNSLSILNSLSDKKKEPATTQPQPLSKEKLPIQNPEALPNEISHLDQLAFESFLLLTLDEGLTQWKNDLTFQSQKMQTLAQNFKVLDGQIEKNFESIQNMILYRTRLQNDSDKSLAELKDIILEEDQVLEHLNYLDNTLGNYLEEIDKTNLKGKSQDKESLLYNNILEVSKSMDSIETVIKEANEKVSVNQIEEKAKEESSPGLIYENEQLHEKMPFEKSEMDYILNSFYVSIRAIQSMQQTLNGKIVQAESEIDQLHKERQPNTYMSDSYY